MRAIPECLATVEGSPMRSRRGLSFGRQNVRKRQTASRRRSSSGCRATGVGRRRAGYVHGGGWTDVRWDWVDNRNRAHTGDPRNSKPGGFYDSGSPEDAWPELTAAERRADELERRAK